MSEDEISSEELEALRRKKRVDLQRAQEQKEIDNRKQAMLRLVLTPDARIRLNNIKVVRPDFAAQLELQLLQLAKTGKVNLPLTDTQLKEVLKTLQSQKKDFKIRRF